MNVLLKYILLSPCILGTIWLTEATICVASDEDKIEGCLDLRATKFKLNKLDDILNLTVIDERGTSSVFEASHITDLTNGKKRLKFGNSLTLEIFQNNLFIQKISQDLKDSGIEFETDFNVEIGSLIGIVNCLIKANNITIRDNLEVGLLARFICNNFDNYGDIIADRIFVESNEKISNYGMISGREIIFNGEFFSPDNLNALTASTSLSFSGISKSSIVAIDRFSLVSKNTNSRFANCIIQTKNLNITGKTSFVDSDIKTTGNVFFEDGSCQFIRTTFVSEETIQISNMLFNLDEKSKILCEGNVFYKGGGFKSSGKIKAYSFQAELVSQDLQTMFRELKILYMEQSQNKQNKFVEQQCIVRLKEYMSFHFNEDVPLGVFTNEGEIQAESDISINSDGILSNNGRTVSGESIHLESLFQLLNFGEILNLSGDIKLNCPFGIINKSGNISSANKFIAKSDLSYFLNRDGGNIQSVSDLIIDATQCFENTHSNINSEGNLRLKCLAIINENGEINGKRINFLVNTGVEDELIKTSYIERISQQYRDYFPEKSKVDETEHLDADTSNSSDKTEQKPKDEEESKNTEGRAQDQTIEDIYELAGSISNKTEGIITSADGITAIASGNIENLNSSSIKSPSITLKAFGRLINDHQSQISGDFVAFDFNTGAIWNYHGSEILGESKIFCKTLENSESSSISGNVQISAENVLVNWGSIVSEGDEAFIKAGEYFNNLGLIQSDKFRIISPHAGNSGRILVSDLFDGFNDSLIQNSGTIITDKLYFKFAPQSGSWKALKTAILFEVSQNPYGWTDLSDILTSYNIFSNVITDDLKIIALSANIFNSRALHLKIPFSLEAAQFRNDDLLIADENVHFDLSDSFFNADYRSIVKKKRYKMFTLGEDHDLSHDESLKGFLEGCDIGLSDNTERLSVRGIFKKNLHIKAKNGVRNISYMDIAGKLTIDSDYFSNGWCHESKRFIELPEGGDPRRTFKQIYDFCDSQPCYLECKNGLEISSRIFLNATGEIDVQGGALYRLSDLLVNYGGNITIYGDSIIDVPSFVNTVGTIKTSRADKMYSSIGYITTNQPIFNVLSGKLDITSKQARNNAGYMYSDKGIFLNGHPANDLSGVLSEFKNLSSGISYQHLFNVNRDNLGNYRRQVLGSVLNGGIIRANLTETIEKDVKKASISSSQKIIFDGYDRAVNTGIMHAPKILEKTGKGGIDHGYTNDVYIADEVKDIPSVITFDEHIQREITKHGLTFKNSGNFGFEARGSDVKLPIVIVSNNSDGLKDIKLALTTEKMQSIILKKLQLLTGTGYLKNFSSIFNIAEKTFEDLKDIPVLDLTNFPKLQEVSNGKVILTSNAPNHGLYFKIGVIDGHKTLIPELKISQNDIHQNLRSVSGTIVAEGEDASLILDTDGFLHITSNLHTDCGGYARGKEGQFVETRTYDAYAFTQKTEAVKCGNHFFGLGGAKYRKVDITEWHKIKRMQEPTIISTGENGTFVFVVPKGEVAEFKASLFKGNVGFAGEGKATLNSIRLDSVVYLKRKGKYGRLSTLVPEFLKAVFDLNSGAKIKIAILENNGGIIKSAGDLEIDVDEYIEKVTTAEFIKSETEDIHSGTFSSSHSKSKTTDFVIDMPSIIAENLVMKAKKKIHLEGLTEAKTLKLEADVLERVSRVFYSSAISSDSKSGVFSHGSRDCKAKLAKIVPTMIKVDGDLTTNILTRYLEEGALKSVNRWIDRSKTNVEISPLEIHETMEETVHQGGFSFGIPHKINLPGSGIIDAFGSHGSMAASQLTNGIVGLYGNMKTISKFGLAHGVPAVFGIGTFGYNESDLHSKKSHNFTFESVTEAQNDIDIKSENVVLSGKMKSQNGKINIEATKQLTKLSGYDEVQAQFEFDTAGFSANVLTQTGNISFQSGSQKSRDKIVKKLDLQAPEVNLISPDIVEDNAQNIHTSSSHSFGMGFGVGETHPSISMNYSTNHNGDGFGMGLNLDVSSPEAFKQSALNALKQGVSGALVGQIAQSAGLGDFWSSIAGTLTSAAVSDTNAGLESIGNITITHNDHTTSTEILSINFDQLRQDFHEFLETISPREVYYESYQEPERVGIDVELKRFLLGNGATDKEISELMTVDMEKMLQDREQLRQVRIDITILGKKILDLRLRECAKLFVDSACYVDEFAQNNPRLTNLALNAVGYILAGPVKYVLSIATEKTGLTEQLEEFEAKIAEWSKNQLITEYNMNESVAEVCASGFVFAADFGVRILADQNFTSVLGKARNVQNALIKWHSPELVTSNGLHIKPSKLTHEERFNISYAKKAGKSTSQKAAQRISATRLDVDTYLKGLTDQKGVLLNRGKTLDGHHYYEVMKKAEYKGITFKPGDYISRDTLHHEIEWFRGTNYHRGAIDPMSGELNLGKIDTGRILKIK